MKMWTNNFLSLVPILVYFCCCVVFNSFVYHSALPPGNYLHINPPHPQSIHPSLHFEPSFVTILILVYPIREPDHPSNPTSIHSTFRPSIHPPSSQINPCRQTLRPLLHTEGSGLLAVIYDRPRDRCIQLGGVGEGKEESNSRNQPPPFWFYFRG